MTLVAAGAGILAVFSRAEPAIAMIVLALTLVGVGVGTFMTPNTATLMRRVASDRVGIANALRATLQQAGYLVSAGLGLALATGWLAPDDRQAAYDGTLGVGAGADFVTGFRVAFSVLAALAAIGVAVSCLPQRRPVPPSEQKEEP
jgi:MFS family permease